MDNINAGERSHSVFVIFLLGFLYNLHGALPVYIGSSFLEKIFGGEVIGYIYPVAGIISVVFFAIINRFLRRFGNYRTTIVLSLIELVALVGLAKVGSPLWLGFFFITSFIAVALTNCTIDIFLESFSTDGSTGAIRGTFLTVANIAWVIAPSIVSFILTDGDYWIVYAASAAILVPVIFLLHHNLSAYKDPTYHITSVWDTIIEVRANHDLRNVMGANFLLQIFYTWMAIYMPIHLHEHIGFGWDKIGLIFSIMLIPFVVTELPLGRLADSRWGEKEFMAIGFIIMAISTGIITYVTTAHFWLWAAILFITRIGASIVEVMTETYFFKKVRDDSVSVIESFRTMRPWSNVLAPLVASAFLLLPGMNIQYMFVILGLLLFGGLRYALALKDTR